MKKVGIMQPYLFAYIGYFQTIKAVQEYVIYDDVQFIKGGWINRNNILVGGRKQLFTIQLDGASPNKQINEIMIKDDFSNFLKTVGMAYSRAPYNHDVMTLLEKICNYEDKNLARFIGNSLHEILHYLGIQTKLIYSSELKKDTQLRAQDKVIAICKELGATEYYNAIGGQELYDREVFSNNDIILKFIKSDLVAYPQLTKEFVPALSIIDIMMNNSIEEVNVLLDSYELI